LFSSLACGEAFFLKMALRFRHPNSRQMLTILQASTPDQIVTARELMIEYATALGFELCFQNFDEEMRTLPGKYAAPGGCILLAYWNDQVAGVVAMRPLPQPGVCEMKRLYVHPGFRGKSVGRVLAERIIAEAREIGYQRMRLDTIQGKMDPAIALYRRLGFVEIAPYYQSPVRETLFLELTLAGSAPSA
jgi:GNAT superfamily N-acetyltransferase